MSSDFLVRVRVDQDQAVETYSRELGQLIARMRRIEAEIGKVGGPGLRPVARFGPGQERVRKEIARVRGAQTKTRQAMNTVAVGAQVDLVKRLQRSYQHPSISSGALEALTGSGRNRTVAPSFFGLGDVDVLLGDQRVKYALALEGGTKRHVGRRLTGVWLTAGGGAAGFGAGRGQRFVAMSTRNARSALADGGGGSTSGVITKPIQPHRAYRKMVQYYRPQRKMAAEIRRIYNFRPRGA